ncbi:Aryl hydrocarbon receptor protein 1 [Trichinella pseudospiralis]|uniref:Aryl hydrocarbon receptor protein 1 n=1 Tax=Trichinella pseudospiralis TaxID=6337 RepID=A0A0V0Y667_TRIPS|nr:Aryl hydrocarbon receptor protein 1 [Trichinella pseudospiralis]
MYANRKRHRNFKRIRAENVVQPSGSNPSKRHRERLNSELEALAFLLPFENTIISRLDKLSILRLAVCFLQAKNVFQNILKQHLQCLYFHDYPFLSNSKFETENVLMTALSGFLLMLNQNGDVLYVSENVSTYLGFHQCILKILNKSDWFYREFQTLEIREISLIHLHQQLMGACPFIDRLLFVFGALWTIHKACCQYQRAK